jgi:hypothetical protein
MATLNLFDILRTALLAVPGYEELPEGMLPTLPILEATVFGQQHLITTFSLGPPPAEALMPGGTFCPALSLRVILPQGYSYWQPETGTDQHLPPVTAVELLPEYYHTLLRQCVDRLAVQPDESYPVEPLSAYLELLAHVAESGWLLREHPAPHEEKPWVLELQQHLAQLATPGLAPYYHARGRALYAWMERISYEKNWVEQAIDAMWRTAPPWLQASQQANFTVEATQAIPAVLDGRQCLVTAFYQVSSGVDTPASLVYLPFGACYISYPDTEIIWRPLTAADYFDLPAALRDENGRPYLGKKQTGAAGSDVAALATSYRQAVSRLLERKWLLTYYAVTEEERNIAQTLQQCIDQLYTPPLVAYYQHHAWQLLGWLRRAGA